MLLVAAATIIARGEIDRADIEVVVAGVVAVSVTGCLCLEIWVGSFSTTGVRVVGFPGGVGCKTGITLRVRCGVVLPSAANSHHPDKLTESTSQPRTEIKKAKRP